MPQATERLKVVGKWMKVNKESIYGTTASPFEFLEWGRCTKKAVDGQTSLYLHVFDWPTDGKLLVPGLKNKVQSAKLLANGQALETMASEDGVVISLPAEATDQYASVLVLNVDGVLEVTTNLPTLGKNGRLLLTSDRAFIHNNEGSQNAEVRTKDLSLIHI